MASSSHSSLLGRLGPAYWRLWLATTVSCFGDGLTMVAMPLLALRLTSDPRLIAGAAIAKQLPWLLVALPAGALADRFDRRRLMVRTDVARMAALVVFAGLVLTDSLTLPVLYASAFVFGSLECLFAGAAGAALPSLVPADELDRANGYLYATETVAGQLAGPAVGAALFAAATAGPFAGDAATFVVSAALLARAWPRPAAPPLEPSDAHRPAAAVSRLWRDVADGVRCFVEVPLLRVLSAVVATASFCQAAVMAILALFAVQVLGLSEGSYGVFLGVAATGNVVGGVIASRMTTRFGAAQTVTAGMGLAGASYLAVGLVSSPVLAAAVLFVEALGVACGSVATLSLRQTAVPDHLRGRVTTTFRAAIFGVMPLGALAGGLLAAAFGVRTALIATGAAALLGAAGTAGPLRRLVFSPTPDATPPGMEVAAAI